MVSNPYGLIRAALRAEVGRAPASAPEHLSASRLRAFIAEVYVTFALNRSLEDVHLRSRVAFGLSTSGRDTTVQIDHEASISFRGAVDRATWNVDNQGAWLRSLLPAQGLGDGDFAMARVHPGVQEFLNLDGERSQTFVRLIDAHAQEMQWAFRRVQFGHALVPSR